MTRPWTVMTALVFAGFVGCTDASERTVGFRDEKITADVEVTLRTKVPGSIVVATRDGVVTLSGTVPDSAARDRAAELARHANGVARVENNLRATIAADAPAPIPPVSRPNAPELK